MLRPGMFTVRGGSWVDFLDNARAVDRFYLHPDHRNVDCGFRVVCPTSTPPQTADYRTLRGGSWFNDSRFARAAGRNGSHPDLRSLNIGFRVLCTAPQEEQ